MVTAEPVSRNTDLVYMSSKNEILERINSISETMGSFDTCRPFIRLTIYMPFTLARESKLPFVSLNEFIRS